MRISIWELDSILVCCYQSADYEQKGGEYEDGELEI